MKGDKLAPMTVEEIEEPINANATYEPLIEAERQAAADAEQDNKGRGVLRFYELAKKQEWQVRVLKELRRIPDARLSFQKMSGGGMAAGRPISEKLACCAVASGHCSTPASRSVSSASLSVKTCSYSG